MLKKETSTLRCSDKKLKYRASEFVSNHSSLALDVSLDILGCYNVWEHTFTKDEISKDLADAGFRVIEFYGDIAGGKCSNKEKLLCVVAEKM